MGTSTDAIFFYGICWDEEDHAWPWSSDDDDDAEPVSDEEWLEANGLSDEIVLGTHCSDSAPMGYAAVKGTEVTAWRGSPQQVSTGAAEHGGIDAPLVKFCKAAGYDFRRLVKEGKVGWWICSYWSV